MTSEKYHKTIVSTLGYILSEDAKSVLQVHRTGQADDQNHGKYSGVGGKLKRGEDVATCMMREIREETGLEVVTMKLRGTVCWADFGPEKQDWLAFIFLVTCFEGEPFPENDEGPLKWVKIDKIYDLPMWKGDAHFLPLIFDSDPRPFYGFMRYEGEEPKDWKYVR